LPSIPALARLVGAAGLELTLGLRKPPGRLRRLSGPAVYRIRLLATVDEDLPDRGRAVQALNCSLAGEDLRQDPGTT
jgi:hypothetical protein